MTSGNENTSPHTSSPDTSNEPQDESSPQVIGPDGTAIAAASAGTSLGDLVEQPAKVMRIGSMVRQLLEEVKAAPLDAAGRARLRDIHVQSISELQDGLAPELVDELERLSLPFEDESPTESELRVAQAQLVGWLEGLFHGIQAALYAQQVQAQHQFQNMRLALPGSNDANGDESTTSSETPPSGGMYL
jgi:hypothetical protein